MPRLDRNGYRTSLFDTEDGRCYVCKTYRETARHEVLFGPNRQLSKRYGLWINVCPGCHDRVHKASNEDYLYLKEKAQRLFEKEYPDDSFLAIFGRNYI